MEKRVIPPGSRILVYHDGYGCETGCCGHSVRLSTNEEYDRDSFEFAHPDSKEAAVTFAKRLVEREYGEEHVKDLDWEHSEVIPYDDCEW